jgi:hypothetical protein
MIEISYKNHWDSKFINYVLLEEFWFSCRQGQEILHFYKASRPTAGPTQSAVQRVIRVFSGGVQWSVHEADLMPVLQMHGAMLSILCMPLFHNALSSTGTALPYQVFSGLSRTFAVTHMLLRR